MPFSFLNPWLWLGAAALAVPLWLHLRRRRESNLLRFSTLRFLEDQPQPRHSSWRLRDRLLLAVRALALLLLVTGFAWPYLRGGNTGLVRESRVYILDNTLSRQADDGFAHDRDRVVNELSQAGPDLQVAVVELTSMPQVVVAFSDDRQAARQRLEALRPSFERGSYLAAFRQASALLDRSLGKQRRIIFLGDSQENQWSENVNSPPFLRNVQIELPKPGATQMPNLSLAEPRVQRVFLGDKSLINFTAKLSHTGPAKSANLIVRANGQAVLSRPINLEQQPETIVVQAQWEAASTGWLRGEAVIEGTPDALPADNRVFFSLAPVVEGKVALLAQSPWLRLALSPEVMRGQWSTRLLEPAGLDAELAATQDADVLCLESSYLQASAARKLLNRYLANGRGVLLLVNRSTPAIDGCLRELGFEPEGAARAQRPEKFQFVLSNHPIFHPFTSPDYGNLMDIKVSEYVRLKAPGATPLVLAESGAGLFFQSAKGPGKLFVAAFGLDREHTSWPVDQTFIPFLDLTLQAARAEDPTPTTFEPGELSTVLLPAGIQAREVALRDEGDREIARAPVIQGRTQLRMPDQPGLYALTVAAQALERRSPTRRVPNGHDRAGSETGAPDSEQSQIVKLFSVNPSPKESRLVYIANPEAMRTWRLNQGAETPQSTITPPRAEIRLTAILQQRFWWWMVLGGLLALFLEMALAEKERHGNTETRRRADAETWREKESV